MRGEQTMTPWALWLAHPRVEAATGESPPPDVDAIVQALSEPELDRTHVANALAIYAWERAATGSVDLLWALTDISHLWRELEKARRTPFSRRQAQRYLVDAWIDATAADRGSPGIDPLSGLHTVGYLYGRVHELDRLTGGHDPTPLMLIVIRWRPPDGPWARIDSVLQVASALHARIRPTATISHIGGRMAVALVPDDARARFERNAVYETFQIGNIGVTDFRVDVYTVPDIRSQLPELVTQLYKEATVDLATGPPGTLP